MHCKFKIYDMTGTHQVRSEMASKRVLVFYRLNKVAFDYVIGEIHAKFMAAKVTITVPTV